MPNNIRIGCDITNLSRFESILNRTPSMRDRMFLPSEQEGATLKNLAGIFAAKEAIIKATDLDAGDWNKIEIIKDSDGRPKAKIPKSNNDIQSQDISISHDGDYIFAVAVFLTK